MRFDSSIQPMRGININIQNNSLSNSFIIYIVKYFINLKVAFHVIGALWGFILFIALISQCISGTMLSFSLITESMSTSLSREEEDGDNNYTDDFFWLHERGVDVIIISAFIHLLRKLYLGVNDIEQEYAWKSGVFSFLMIQLVIFTGLVLCATHLSEITLTIVANIIHSITYFKGKVYWWAFTDKFLNTDTMIRLAYAHYVLAFFLLFLGLVHGVDMHYDWKAKGMFSNLKQQLNWWDEALLNELSFFLDFLILLGLIGEFLYSEPEALNYEIFMWGDIGLVTDIRFYGVAPHWYFRPYMAWLIICPYHYLGLFGLIYFFLVLYFQVSIFGSLELENLKKPNSIHSLFIEIKVFLRHYFYTKKRDLSPRFLVNKKRTRFRNHIKNFTQWNSINYDLSLQWYLSYGLFLITMLCTLSYLPYGRFYNRIGGNTVFLMAYFYIFSFLAFSSIRNSWVLNNYITNIFNY